MKILHVINTLGFGGAEKLLVESIPLYIPKGISIDLLLLSGEGSAFYNDLKKNEISIYCLPNVHSLYNPWNIFKIKKYLKGYDLIHVHLFPAIYWVAMAVLLNRRKTPLILTEHNTYNRRRKIPLFKYIDRFIYRKYSKIIAISESARVNLARHLGKQYVDKIVTINNGINLTAIEKAKPYDLKEFKLNPNIKLVIQVSSFTEQKDQSTVIRAMAELPENVHLLLVGDGPKIEVCKNLASHFSLGARVHFLGHRKDVPRLLKTADISVLSSHYEGFGLAMVEGMAAGNVCIGSRVDGLSEVIKGAGILFEKGNHTQLSQIIMEAISDKAYAALIQKKCIERSKSYAIGSMVNKYIEVYKNIRNRQEINT